MSRADCLGGGGIRKGDWEIGSLGDWVAEDGGGGGSRGTGEPPVPILSVAMPRVLLE